MENEQLISAIRDGSREAFDQMCGRYYAPLIAYARLFLNGNWAQDVVQDVFVNVWTRREMLDPAQSLYGYMLRSVYNKSVNYANKHRHAVNYRSYHQQQIESMGYAYYDPDKNSIIETLYSQDLRASINDAVSALPAKCREVFSLSYLQGLSHREISDRLGIAQSTVENHIYLALKTLRAKLSRSELMALMFLIFLKNL
ncbi:RNA polymerase sigma-70 factor [uncultured Alistipes sp.]|jgi:RNA polymerase sigma-70 factor|uniref:RNA polymerase sigma-70 factor n=1 Tax=uncultured Alistipes sp. TaxID=538949 RepID=UPI0025F576B1|nr:RNA polymerase sigma-70 factor [uncultured Alistipes sp.]